MIVHLDLAVRCYLYGEGIGAGYLKYVWIVCLFRNYLHRFDKSKTRLAMSSPVSLGISWQAFLFSIKSEHVGYIICSYIVLPLHRK